MHIYLYVIIITNICTYKHVCIYTYMYTGSDWVVIGVPCTVREYDAPRKNIVLKIVVLYWT